MGRVTSGRRAGNAGFTEIEDVPQERQPLVISAFAPEGCGKTQFGLTAPDPLYVFGIDPNTKAITRKYKREHPERQILLQEFNAPLVSFSSKDDGTAAKDAAEAEWNRFLDVYRAVLEGAVDPAPRSVLLDTATEFFELQKLGMFGRLIQIPQHLYTPLNAVYQDVLKAGRRAGVNLILLHRAKEKYEDKIVRGRNGPETKSFKVEGEWERQGFNRTGNMVELEVRLQYDGDRGNEIEERFGMKVIKNTERPITTGEEFWGTYGKKTKRPYASVPFCGTLLYPDTTASDWE